MTCPNFLNTYVDLSPGTEVKNSPNTHNSQSTLVSRCSSRIHVHPGNVEQMKTRTGSCVSIFRKELTSPGGAPKTLKQSPIHSIPDPGKHSDGRPQQKYSTTNYSYSNNPVLQRPVEFAHNCNIPKFHITSLAQNSLKLGGTRICRLGAGLSQ